jgi:hypothetical protein
LRCEKIFVCANKTIVSVARPLVHLFYQFSPQGGGYPPGAPVRETGTPGKKAGTDKEAPDRPAHEPAGSSAALAAGKKLLAPFA